MISQSDNLPNVPSSDVSDQYFWWRLEFWVRTLNFLIYNLNVMYIDFEYYVNCRVRNE